MCQRTPADSLDSTFASVSSVMAGGKERVSFCLKIELHELCP